MKRKTNSTIKEAEPDNKELELFRLNKWLGKNYPKIKKEYEQEDEIERELTNVYIKETWDESE